MDSATRDRPETIEPVATGAALLTSDQVADEILSVPVSTVQALSREHKLPTVRIGRTYRYRRAAVEAWVEKNES
jgi:excisionase family DNA binding protein